jgi:hypothetical protein
MIAEKYERYSTLWFGADAASEEEIGGICAEMSAIEKWAKRAMPEATSRHDHEMLAAIRYAATGVHQESKETEWKRHGRCSP